MGNTILVVSHDMGVHYQVTDKMLIMYAGRVVETLAARDLDQAQHLRPARRQCLRA